MKKLFTLIFLYGMMLSAYAQKTYVTVDVFMDNSYTTAIVLSGAIPSSMKEEYGYKDFGYRDSVKGNKYIGNVLNLLANNGFVVDHMSTSHYGSEHKATFLLSKASNTSNSVKSVQYDPDEEVTEVARYNLQGIPVKDYEKGVQIVVYSNYTTKTIIVE